jgi:hypothetical protein
MRRQVELYIKKDNESGTGYERVDLFDFEDININNSIKDARDIGKVFTEFTQEFKVPASKNNNKLFSHYYNWDISVGGFDARLKVPALIKINGVDYKKGRLTLKGSALNKNRAKNYSVVFYGETVSLKQLLSDDKLKDLNTSHLNQFELEYTSLNVRNGLINGYNLSGGSLVSNIYNNAGDLCVPFISAQNYYFYDSTQNAPNPAEGASESRNINVNESALVTPRGISFGDLKFGIRVYHIIKAIEEKYGLTFSTDFFSTTNPDFYELYLFLSKEKGQYSEDGGTVITDIDDFSLDSANELRPLTTWNAVRGAEIGYQKYTVTYTVQTAYPNSSYNVTVTSGGGITYLEQSGGGLSTTFSFAVESPASFSRQEVVRNLEFKIQGENVGNFGQSLSITRRTREYVLGTGFVITTVTSNYSLAGEPAKFNITGNMPDIKVIDFLTSLFKTFNLVAYYDNEKINVKTLVDYYDNGQSIDLTDYVDNNVANLNRTNLYSTINFEFEKPSTFAVLNSNEITSDEFGNERMNNLNQDPEIFSTLAFDGGTYNVKNKFEKIMYERMTNQTGGANTNVGWGWLVNKDQDSVLTKPILFYGIQQQLSSAPSGNSPSQILFDNSNGTYSSFPQYIRASNTRSYYSGLFVEAQSINFGSEFDEFNQVENTTSLFKTYYEEYVQDIYNRRSRILKVKAFLPVSVVLRMTLDDEVTIGNRLYGINKMKLNLNTGKADLELMTRTASKLS